ncbi:MAG: insulinase family protein [Myxococcales bacterium]|nr:insulinase family protein [Myxococcales bacterium]
MTDPISDHRLDDVPMPYAHRVRRLANNFEVVTVHMPHLHVAQIALLVQVGSRNETPEKNGLSHMVEHMFFRGCDGYENSTALNTAMEDLGGHLDAYTTRDHSGYVATVHPRYVSNAIDIMGKMFTSPRFQDIEVERRIILEEILDSLDERGEVIDIDTLSHRLHFGDHGLGQPIEGSRENIRSFNMNDLLGHREQFYGLENMVLCIAGSFNEDVNLQTAELAFSNLSRGTVTHKGPPPKPPSPSFHYKRTDDPQTRIRLSIRIVSEHHADYPALAVLRHIMDGGLSARLQTEIVEKRGLAYEVGADLLTYADVGTLEIEFAAAHSTVPQTMTTLAELLTNLKTSKIPDKELFRVHHRLRINLEIGLDSVNEMVQSFGVDHLFGLSEAPGKRLARLTSITSDDVQRVARKYLRGDILSTVAVGGAKPKEVTTIRKAVEQLRHQLASQ